MADKMGRDKMNNAVQKRWKEMAPAAQRGSRIHPILRVHPVHRVHRVQIVHNVHSANPPLPPNP